MHTEKHYFIKVSLIVLNYLSHTYNTLIQFYPKEKHPNLYIYYNFYLYKGAMK